MLAVPLVLNNTNPKVNTVVEPSVFWQSTSVPKLLYTDILWLAVTEGEIVTTTVCVPIWVVVAATIPPPGIIGNDPEVKTTGTPFTVIFSMLFPPNENELFISMLAVAGGVPGAVTVLIK